MLIKDCKSSPSPDAEAQKRSRASIVDPGLIRKHLEALQAFRLSGFRVFVFWVIELGVLILMVQGFRV